MPANSSTPKLKRFVELDADDGVTRWFIGHDDYILREEVSETTRNNIVRSYTHKNNISWYALSDLSGLRTALDLNEILIFIDAQALTCDQPPVIREGRTLVPLRVIFEGLGATVDWNDKTRTVTSPLGNTTIKLSIDDNIMYKNGSAVALDAPAQIIGNRTMIPVRAIAEAFGADVY